MLLLVLCMAWAAVVALLIARAVRQYGAYEQLPVPQSNSMQKQSGCAEVRVILPARNERHNIELCLAGLLAQDYPPEHLKIVVVDDGSIDGTAQVVRAIEQSNPRVRLVIGGALPAGWKGKPFACWQGAQAVDDELTAAGMSDADAWLCFIDCDTRARPGLIRAAVTRAQQGVDLLSLEPFQELDSFWERVLIPAGFLLLAFSQDLRRVNDPSQPDACANGQFILVRRRAYAAVGGHAATRAAIAEDSALAQLVKSAGMRIAVIGAEKLLSTRMYRSLCELWEGVSKNLVEMVGGTKRTLAFATAGVVLALAALLLPAIAWWRVAQEHSIDAISLAAAISASIASGALFGVHIGAARYLRIPWWYGLFFPLGYLSGAVLAADSIRRRASHRIAWKGRVYARPDAEA